MANELVVGGFNITYSKDGARVTIPRSQASITVAGDVIAQGIISVATSAANLAGLPATQGMAFLFNLDDTNYVTFGPDSGADAGVLSANDGVSVNFALYKPAGASLYLKANTAACEVQYVVFSA